MFTIVIPAQAGIQTRQPPRLWTLAFAGVTDEDVIEPIIA